MANVTTNISIDDTKRFRLVISDGVYTHQRCVMLGEKTELIETEFDRYCLMKLARYALIEIQICNVIVLYHLQNMDSNLPAAGELQKENTSKNDARNDTAITANVVMN